MIFDSSVMSEEDVEWIVAEFSTNNLLEIEKRMRNEIVGVDLNLLTAFLSVNRLSQIGIHCNVV